MRLAPASLGGRLLLGATLLTLAALAVTGLAMGFALTRFVRAQVDGRLDAQVEAIADALRPVPEGGVRLERNVDGPPFDRPGSGWFWQVLGPSPALASRSLDGRALALGAEEERPMRPGPRGHGRPPPLDDRPPPRTAEGTASPGEPLRVRLRSVEVGGAPVTVLAAAPRQALTGPVAEAMAPLGATLLLLAAMLVGGGLLQVRLGLRPLARLKLDLAAVRAGAAERIDGPQPAEVAPLVAELNGLLDQHAANLERARRNVANLAHGLKTPLATLGVALEGEGGDPARLRALVGTMDRLIRHHLSRARAAALGGVAARARVLLAPRLADHRAAFSRLYASRNLSVVLDVPDDLAAACEAQDLDEMLGNLLDNACKWARARVVVTARGLAEGTLEIVVADDGPGLGDGQAADVLRPGRRIDESAPGYGFGLPIARELAELYGGSLALGAAPLGGLAVTLRLPRAP